MMHEFSHSIRFRRSEFRVSKLKLTDSFAPASLDRYLATVPAMKYKCGSHLIRVTPLYFFLSLLSNLRKRAVV